MTGLRSISSYVETGGVTTLYVKFVLIFFLVKTKVLFTNWKRIVLLLKKKNSVAIKKTSVTIDKFK